MTTPSPINVSHSRLPNEQPLGSIESKENDDYLNSPMQNDETIGVSLLMLFSLLQKCSKGAKDVNLGDGFYSLLQQFIHSDEKECTSETDTDTQQKEGEFLLSLPQKWFNNDVKHEADKPKSPPVKVLLELCVSLRNQALHKSPLEVAETFALSQSDIRRFIPFKHIWRGVSLDNENLSGADLSGADLRGVNLSRVNLSGADLRGADLSGQNLSKVRLNYAKLGGANLSGANLSGANLFEANLSGANLFRANLFRADLRGANLRGINLSGADLFGADLFGADLSGADLSGADLSGADLSGVKSLSGANLLGADLHGADLSWANLNGVKSLSGANLSGTNLSGANLSGANLLGANLSGANLLGANLLGANLLGANLRGANLRGINLSGADLFGADLFGADLFGADLSGANLSGANLSGVDLSPAKDLSGANLFGAKLGEQNLGLADRAKVKFDSPDKANLVEGIRELEAMLEDAAPLAPSLLPIFDIYKEFTNYISKREQRQGLSSKIFQPEVTCNYKKLSFILQVGCVLLQSVNYSQPSVALLDTIKKLTDLDSRTRAVSDILRPRRLGNNEFSLSNYFQGLLKIIRTKSDKHQSSPLAIAETFSLFQSDIRRVIPFKHIWREINPIKKNLIEADLRWADFSGLDLSTIKLSGADLRWADFSRTNFRGADLSEAKLGGANLRGVIFFEADLRGANLLGTNLRKALIFPHNLSKANLSGQNLSETKRLGLTNLSGAKLFGADLSGADLSGVDLSGADLSGADLSGANLSGTNLLANLLGADLRWANLSGADLSGADLSGADLRGANLRGANLSGANLSEANLSGTDLSEAKNLIEANLSGANLSGAKLGEQNLGLADHLAKVKFDSPDKANLVEGIRELEAMLKDAEPLAPSLLPIFDIYKEFTNYISKREQRQGLSSKIFQPEVTCNDQKLSFILQVGCILLQSVNYSQPSVALLNTIKKLTDLDSRTRAVSDILRPRRLGNTEFSLSNHFQGLLENIRTKSDEHQSSQDNQLTEAERQHDGEPPQPPDTEKMIGKSCPK
jgi:uncharacterized protein YjbI with pentapeptide repeats